MEKMSFDIKSNSIDLQMNFHEALKDNDFCNIIKSLDVSEDVLKKNTSSLKECAKEFANCKNCKGLGFCKNSSAGYVMMPKSYGSGINISYIMCEYKKNEKFKDNVKIYDLPVSLRDASISEIYNDDKVRIEIIKMMKKFNDSYLKGETCKGIYLHGSFGVGKSYLIAALFNELAKHDVKSVIVHTSEFIRSIKESFDSDYGERFDIVKNVPLLLFDDIGAEYLTSWARDEVIEPILQYRMDQKLPTFFTSNLNMEELEKHFAINGEAVKAKRIIERISEVSTSVKLEGKNRRK